MTSEELSVLPDATLIAIARNCPKYEQSESLRELVMELAKRLEAWISGRKTHYPATIKTPDTYWTTEQLQNYFAANLLLRD